MADRVIGQLIDWPRLAAALREPIPEAAFARVVGYCWTCDVLRTRRECRQTERDECCVHVCRVCDSIIDEDEDRIIEA